MAKTIQVPASLVDGTLTFVDLASYTIKRAQEEVTVHRAQQKRAADLRGPVLEHLIATGMVAPGMRKEAESMLGSHAETLQLLKAAVDKLVAHQKQDGVKAASDLGTGVPDAGTAAPAFDSLTDPHVGRRTSEKKASDLALASILDAPAR